MATIALTWLAVPGGFTEKKPDNTGAIKNNLVVYAIPIFSPKDVNTPSSDLLPDDAFLNSWPDLIRALNDNQWQVQINNGQPGSCKVMRTEKKESTNLWKKVFQLSGSEVSAPPAIRDRKLDSNRIKPEKLALTTLPSAALHLQLHRTYDKFMQIQAAAKSNIRSQAKGKGLFSAKEMRLNEMKLLEQVDFLKWSNKAGDYSLPQPDVLTHDSRSEDVPVDELITAEQAVVAHARRNYARLGSVMPKMKDSADHRTAPERVMDSYLHAAVQRKLIRMSTTGEQPARPSGGADDWQSFVHALVFHGRAANDAPSVQKGDAGDLEHAKQQAQSTVLAPDILDRIAFIKNYPQWIELLGLAVRLEVTIDNLTILNPTGQENLIGVSVDSLGGPIRKNTSFTYGLGTEVFTAFEAAVYQIDRNAHPEWAKYPFAGGYVNLSNNSLSSTSNPSAESYFQFSSLDLNGASLKLVNTAAAISATEGFAAVIDVSGDMLAANYVARHPNSFRASMLTFQHMQARLARITDRKVATNNSPLAFDAINGTYGAVQPIQERDDRGQGGWNITAFQWQGFSNWVLPSPVPTLPSLRSDGISLYWQDRAASFAAKQDRVDQFNAKQQQQTGTILVQTLYAEDLLLGYLPRVFVKKVPSDKGRWFSLTARDETYSFDDGSIQEFQGVNAVLRLTASHALDSAASDQPSTDLHFGTSLFTWNGWQLGVKKPFQLTDRMGVPSNIRWSFQPTISVKDHAIAPLRYGYYYRFCLPTLSISGRPLEGYKVRDSAHAPPAAMRYLRYDPVKAPEILLDRAPGDEPIAGRGIHRMVVTEKEPTDVRWVAPPRADLECAERHGLLDDPSLECVGSFNDVELTENGDFPNVAPIKPPIDPKKPTPVPPTSEQVPIRRPPCPFQDPKTPYYPDYMAEAWTYELEYADESEPLQQIRTSGMVTDATDLQGDTNYECSFYRHELWPHARVWRLILIAGPEGQEPTCKPDSGSRILRVHLPPGCTARLHVKSVLRKNSIELMALANPDATRGRQYINAALASDLSLITPEFTIELAHACPQPIMAPSLNFIEPTAPLGLVPDTKIDGFSIYRPLNATTVNLTACTHVNIPSTGKLVFKAAWDDPVDDGGSGGVVAHRGAATLREQTLPLTLGGTVNLAGSDLTQHLPDTGYHLMEYSATATTRYIEQFPNFTPVELGLPGEPFRIQMLNCGHPPPPLFQYPVPTYLWSKKEVQEVDSLSKGQQVVPKFKHLRSAFIRLCFSPQWFLTGEDELIGVLLPTRQPGSDLDALREVTTRWGADPLRQNGISREWPTPKQFTGYVTFLPGEIIDPYQLAKRLHDPADGSIEAFIVSQLSSESVDLIDQAVGKQNAGRSLRVSLSEDFDALIQGDVPLLGLTGEGSLHPSARVCARRAWFQGLNPTDRIFITPSPIFDAHQNDWKTQTVPVAKPGDNNDDNLTAGPRVRVVPYRPQFNSDTNLWYVDVGFTDLPAEYLFVQMVVSRFQPHSIDIKSPSENTVDALCHLSKSVQVDFAQIAPDRLLSVWRDPEDKEELTICVRIESGNIRSECPGTTDQEFAVQIWKQGENGWLYDPVPEIKTATDDASLIFTRIRFTEHVGPRRLVVLEREKCGTAAVADNTPVHADEHLPFNLPYINVLDI